MEDDLCAEETCFDVINSSISVVECVLDLVHTVVNQELGKNHAPKSDNSDVLLTTDSHQQQFIPILEDYVDDDPVYCEIEKRDQPATEEKTEFKMKSKHRKTECSVNSLHLLFEEVNAVLTEMLESVTTGLPTTQEEEDVSTKSDSLHQDDGDNHEIGEQNEDEKFEEITIDEMVECPLDGLRSLLKTVPYIKLPVPEPSPPSPLPTPEMKDNIEVELKEKTPVDYLQVLRILRPPPPPPKKTENTEEGEIECVSDGPNENEEEQPSTAIKNERSVVGSTSTEILPVKTPDTVENGEDRESINSDSTIFIPRAPRKSKRNNSEVTPVSQTYTSIKTDSETKPIEKQKKEKGIKKKAKMRTDEDDQNDSNRNLYSKKEEVKPLASTKKSLLSTNLLKNPVLILSRCDDNLFLTDLTMAKFSRKRKRSESHSSASQRSPEKVEVGKDPNFSTNSHSTIFMSSVLQKLRKNHLAKVKPASVTFTNKESETGATKKQKKEKPVKNKTKINLDEDDRDNANSNSTILLSKKRLTRNHAGKQISASGFNASDSITSPDLEKQINHKQNKAKSVKKKVKAAEKSQKECKEVLDGKDNSNTSSESLFLMISPTKSSFTDKDRVSEGIFPITSKVKKKKRGRVPAIENKEETSISSKSVTVINKTEQKHVEEIETREEEPKGKCSTKLEDTSFISKKKKGKESATGQKRKRSSSPVPSSSSAEKSDALLLKKWSLKPCYVVLRRDSIDLLENSSLKKKGTTKKIEQLVEPEVIVINGDEDESDVVYPCPICDRVFSISAKLEKHMKKKHSTPASSNVKEKSSKACELCGKKFSGESAMYLHVRSHLGEAPYKCNKCEEHFVKKSELKSHQKRHEEEEAHDCAVCGKTFANAVSKKRHVANHFKRGRFICSICNKGFPRHQGLKLHIRMKHEQKRKRGR